MNMTEIKGYLLTEEETEACLAIIKKMREEKEKKIREEAIQRCKHAISSQIADSISKIGLEETKRIIRELNRELRAC